MPDEARIRIVRADQSNCLKMPLSQADLPSESECHNKGAKMFYLSCLSPIHKDGQLME